MVSFSILDIFFCFLQLKYMDALYNTSRDTKSNRKRQHRKNQEKMTEKEGKRNRRNREESWLK